MGCVGVQNLGVKGPSPLARLTRVITRQSYEIATIISGIIRFVMVRLPIFVRFFSRSDPLQLLDSLFLNG